MTDAAARRAEDHALVLTDQAAGRKQSGQLGAFGHAHDTIGDGARVETGDAAHVGAVNDHAAIDYDQAVLDRAAVDVGDTTDRGLTLVEVAVDLHGQVADLAGDHTKEGDALVVLTEVVVDAVTVDGDLIIAAVEGAHEGALERSALGTDRAEQSRVDLDIGTQGEHGVAEGVATLVDVVGDGQQLLLRADQGRHDDHLEAAVDQLVRCEVATVAARGDFTLQRGHLEGLGQLIVAAEVAVPTLDGIGVATDDAGVVVHMYVMGLTQDAV